MESTLPFLLHGRDGTVTIAYGPNDEPERWGYTILGHWGYSTGTDHKPELVPPTALAESDWQQAIPLLEENFPDWTFEPAWHS
jgi:hypothetical protein